MCIEGLASLVCRSADVCAGVSATWPRRSGAVRGCVGWPGNLSACYIRSIEQPSGTVAASGHSLVPHEHTYSISCKASDYPQMLSIRIGEACDVKLPLQCLRGPSLLGSETGSFEAIAAAFQHGGIS